jgi:hypothetical protein
MVEWLCFVRRKLRFASVNLGGVHQVPCEHFGPRKHRGAWGFPNGLTDGPKGDGEDDPLKISGLRCGWRGICLLAHLGMRQRSYEMVF